ncbi:sugar transporter [Bradyrhizobium sp. INPA01-394B]|uniref:Sugar transporter n=1 Tax=Bradyrhizobium campsiandrae TaxID=1729892 RepID=A0ABR7UEK7_9BRAD|nr:sugar transporter [Bradyrhizobium campsiandrae]MBC9878317.1 sugar transporter [Bradyrhizobium campsiandrae]MBC9982399.1 sugar transporter [Bradyrhizobium campsiandrae]
MLQKIDFEDNFDGQVEQDRSHLLQPSYYLDIIKRRWPFFVVPFILIALVGTGAVLIWPPTYLSEGKILVQSQQIPTELVRPTVTSAAQERIQVIQQRTMTRDNLIAIADKFQLFPEKRTLMSVTELVELMKKSTKITPVDPILDFKQRTRTENPTIVFSVGFEYGDPAVAARVANELMTRILNEDLRDRTSRATDTSRFLSREVQRLQTENAALDAKIAQLRIAQGKPATTTSGQDQPTSTLAQLKAELIQKSALYSDKHPMIQSLKRQIQAMESVAQGPAQTTNGNDAAAAASLDALVAQQESLQKNLETATAKLMAARLGENLEKDQQSEKLEVIEQPTAPQEPIKPHRPKLLALTLALAFAAGAGLTFVLELTDKAIRRSSDLFAIVDNRLIVPVPYIATKAELRRQKRRRIAAVVIVVLLVAALLGGAYFFMPPLDLMLAKARAGLFR